MSSAVFTIDIKQQIKQVISQQGSLSLHLACALLQIHQNDIVRYKVKGMAVLAGPSLLY